MRNDRGWRGAVLAITLMLAALSQAQTETQTGAEAGAAGETTSETRGANTGDAPAAAGGESSGPEPFVPTEKISADSAVSFPVDI